MENSYPLELRKELKGWQILCCLARFGLQCLQGQDETSSCQTTRTPTQVMFRQKSTNIHRKSNPWPGLLATRTANLVCWTTSAGKIRKPCFVYPKIQVQPYFCPINQFSSNPDPNLLLSSSARLLFLPCRILSFIHRLLAENCNESCSMFATTNMYIYIYMKIENHFRIFSDWNPGPHQLVHTLMSIPVCPRTNFFEPCLS